MRDLTGLPDLTVALVQTTLVWHDREANFAHFDELLEQARGADLVVLPEMFTTGFSMQSEALAEPEHGPTSKWLQAQAKKLNAVVTGSVIVQAADGSHRNRLLWARPDGEVLHYDKTGICDRLPAKAHSCHAAKRQGRMTKACPAKAGRLMERLRLPQRDGRAVYLKLTATERAPVKPG